MYRILSQTTKNRLYLTLQGKMDIAEAKKFVNQATQEIKKLNPGYGVITDISGFELVAEDIRQNIEELLCTIKATKVGHVFRVTNPGYPMVSMQWQRTSWKMGYVAENVNSLGEAERKLDEMEYKTANKMAALVA